MGIGEEFARQLAASGLNLALVDIQQKPLEDLSRELMEKHDIRVRPVTLDLSQPDFMQALLSPIERLEIGLLVCNAGYSKVEWFLDTPIEDHLRMLDVNARSPLLLAHHFGREMVQRKRGGIILLSSLSSLQGTALVATYAATKAYNWVLAESLWDELGERGVDVLAFPPGSTDTPGWRSGNPQHGKGFYVMNARDAVREALENLGKQPSFIPGWRNRLSFALLRLLPRRMATNIVGKQMRNMYGK
jgi:hypothetical protein